MGGGGFLVQVAEGCALTIGNFRNGVLGAFAE